MEYLKSKSQSKVSIREFNDTMVNYLEKNYDFVTLDWSAMVDLILKPFAEESSFESGKSTQKRYYFRSIGENPRKEVSDIRISVPELAAEFILPPTLEIALERFFSRYRSPLLPPLPFSLSLPLSPPHALISPSPSLRTLYLSRTEYIK